MAVTDLPSVTRARSFEDQDNSGLARKMFLAAVVGGVALRLIAAIFGDVGVYADGASRIALAISWADHPSWQGLSGVWPPLHWYFLGTLIDVWNHPILLAKAITLALSIGTIFVFRAAVRSCFNSLVGAMSALLLAISWSHIWLTSSYWVEIPYLFFVILAVRFAYRSIASGRTLDLHFAGLSFALAMLLRHEGSLMMPVALAWYVLMTRDWRRALRLAWAPAVILICCVLEPFLRGHTYFEYFTSVAEMKVAENLVQGLSVQDCLRQWVLMLGASPTVLVVVPGLFGLYRRRSRIRTDVFAWMFLAQFAFYFVMTIGLGWRPQMRYLLLCVVNLLPYAALGWLEIIERFSKRYALAALISLTIVIQSAGWWIGRNNMLAYGWLPVQVVTSSQREMDKWIGSLESQGLSKLSVVSIAPAALDDRWSVVHSALANDIHLSRSGLDEVHVYIDREILAGELPPRVQAADVVLIDPRMSFYPGFVEALKQVKPRATITLIHPDIAVLLVSGRALELAGPIAQLR